MKTTHLINQRLVWLASQIPGFGKHLLLAAILAAGFSRLEAQEYHWVACGNQGSGAYEIYDPTVTDWNTAGALKWSFTPTTSGGWTSAEVAAYSNPSDMKLRWDGTSQVVVSCASGGLATIATYPGGSMIWALDVGGANNPHSVEYLPNGNIAVAAYEGNFVRVYTSSQGSGSSGYVQYSLTGAHAVLWDPTNNALWALGTSALVSLSVGGTAASPTLSLASSVSLPGSGGHDLSPYWGNTDFLWVSVSLNVYLYQKSTQTFTGAPDDVNRTDVKGCGNEPGGEIVQCQPSSSCTSDTWCTPNVNFFTSLGATDYTRTKTGAAFYKCRIFWPDYQPVQIDPPYQFSSGTELWTVGNGLTNFNWVDCCGWTGAIYGDATANDACILSPQCSFTGASNTVVNVNVYAQNGITNAHNLQLFWQTSGESWDTNQMSPMVNYTASNNYVSINLDATSFKWTGQTVTGMGLYFDQNNASNRWLINQIYPQSLVQYTFDSSVQGWFSGHGLGTAAWTACCGWPGVLYATQTASDCYFWGPSISYLGGANDIVQVHVYAQNSPTNVQHMKMYWITTTDTTFTESKSSALIAYTGSNQWATVNLPVGLNTNWYQSPITELRLDLDDNTTNTVGTTWIVDSISTLPQPHIGPNYGFNSTTQGWTTGGGFNPITWTGCCGWPGAIYSLQTSSNACFLSSAMEYQGATNDVLQVRLYPQNTPTNNQHIQLFWQTDNNAAFSTAQSTALVQYTASNSWATINFPVGQNTNWSQSFITQLRLNVDNGTTNTIGTTWIVDYISDVLP